MQDILGIWNSWSARPVSRPNCHSSHCVPSTHFQVCDLVTAETAEKPGSARASFPPFIPKSFLNIKINLELFFTAFSRSLNRVVSPHNPIISVSIKKPTAKFQEGSTGQVTYLLSLSNLLSEKWVSLNSKSFHWIHCWGRDYYLTDFNYCSPSTRNFQVLPLEKVALLFPRALLTDCSQKAAAIC